MVPPLPFLFWFWYFFLIKHLFLPVLSLLYFPVRWHGTWLNFSYLLHTVPHSRLICFLRKFLVYGDWQLAENGHQSKLRAVKFKRTLCNCRPQNKYALCKDWDRACLSILFPRHRTVCKESVMKSLKMLAQRFLYEFGQMNLDTTWAFGFRNIHAFASSFWITSLPKEYVQSKENMNGKRNETSTSSLKS